MADEREPEDLISDAMDILALGYPLDGSAVEKAEWMAMLQKDLERRAPLVLEQMRRSIRED